MKNLEKKFDPSGIGVKNGNIFGLPFTAEQSQLIVIPVPWEVTTSYRGGTAQCPQAILDASSQVDLYDSVDPDSWKKGIFMLPVSRELSAKNKKLRSMAGLCISHLEKGGSSDDAKFKKMYEEINRGSGELNEWVKKESLKFLNQKKKVCVLGGEHSVSLGLIQALAETQVKFSILHLDAHADMRTKYEGFEFSHASAMYNAAKIKNVEKIVQVGVRDYCEQEAEFIKESKGRIVSFEGRAIKKKLFGGTSWGKICDEITGNLAKNVYVSFDVDVLEPWLCPNTGTPVPGGLEFEQALYLVEKAASGGRRIIGFDLCEVTPSKDTEWDAMVGARILYRLANIAG